MLLRTVLAAVCLVLFVWNGTAGKAAVGTGQLATPTVRDGLVPLQSGAFGPAASVVGAGPSRGKSAGGQ